MPFSLKLFKEMVMNDEEELNRDELQLVFLPGKGPSITDLAIYNKVYACWKGLWKVTKIEHQDDSQLFSNDFTRQDEVLALIYKGECAGLCCLKAIDFSEGPSSDDSYFAKWPEFTIRKLQTYGSKILICSQLTVSPAFRKNFLGVSWKDLLVALSARRLQDTSCEVMVGAVRRRRGMEKASYRNGFFPLMIDLPYIGEESVDLVAFIKKKSVPSRVQIISQLVETLYPHAIVLTQHKEVKYAA
jgi:hypothetical protein